MKKLYTLVFSLFLISSVLAQDWNAVEIGICPTDESYDCILADGRNDGVNRLYVTTRHGGIYEWSYDGSSWDYITIDDGMNNLITIMVGDARGDGVNRLYAGQWSADEEVYEYEWNGTDWDRTLLNTETAAVTSVVIGDGRDDGVDRLYVSGFFGNNEYTWNGTGWDIVSINVSTNAVEGPGTIGDCRNDGVNRFVIPQKAGREYTFNGTDWDMTTMTGDDWPESSWLAEGRNDGTNRVYVQDWAGGWECTWNGTDWDIIDITGILGRGEWFAGVAKADGKVNLYSSMVGLAFKEFAWDETGSSYVDTMIMDAASGATSCIDIGDGRNDDTARIYIPHYANGGIYEITYHDPYVYNTTSKPMKEIKEEISIYPNPVNDVLNIKLNTNKYDTYEIRDLQGRLIMKDNISISNLNINTKDLSKGVYTIIFRNEDEIKAEKFVIG